MKRMLRFFTFILLVVLLSCDRNKRFQAINENLDKEIANRLSVLKGMSKYDDSLTIKSLAIHNETKRLILLSKDVENFKACLALSDKYFSDLSLTLQTEIPGNMALNILMDPHDAELRLKETELWFLNKIIFNSSGADIQMFSAQEELPE